jgi:hypothetical protein
MYASLVCPKDICSGMILDFFRWSPAVLLLRVTMLHRASHELKVLESGAILSETWIAGWERQVII